VAEVATQDWPDLYRLASLQRAGVTVKAGSDAPYGDANPWIAIHAAMNRMTRNGTLIAPEERVPLADALSLFGSGDLSVGDAADIALVSIDSAIGGNDAEVTTFIGGHLIA
jgi:predicted amidohydrolase YtcJ